MAMTLPKTLEHKSETLESVLQRASKMTLKKAEEILDKPRKAVMSDRQARRVAREAVIKIRQQPHK